MTLPWTAFFSFPVVLLSCNPVTQTPKGGIQWAMLTHIAHACSAVVTIRKHTLRYDRQQVVDYVQVDITWLQKEYRSSAELRIRKGWKQWFLSKEKQMLIIQSALANKMSLFSMSLAFTSTLIIPFFTIMLFYFTFTRMLKECL